MYLAAQYINQIIFGIQDNLVKLGVLAVNKVQDIKFSIQGSMRQIDYLTHTLPITFIVNLGISQMVKFEHLIKFSFKMVLNPIVGRFRKLGEMDDIELSQWDDMGLGDIDFITL